MTYLAFTHIALIVTPLRQAEEFYLTLFVLAIAFTLALVDGVSSEGERLSHGGVQVDTQELERLRTVTPPWVVRFILPALRRPSQLGPRV